MNEDLKILMLEDNPADAELVRYELKKAAIGFSLKRVDTKEAFMEALKEDVPHIVLADYSLPRLTGLEAFRLFKSLNLFIPFILVTGSLSETLAVVCMKEGMDDYILKDRLMRLPGALRNALEKKKAEREKEEAVGLLKRKLDEVERINKLMVGRELKMGALKKENKKLKLYIEALEKKLPEENLS
ncbi:MAG: response regulator [Deltaproteobacteria bacterium]|nr:response regulator [Deltaproteobacteria bacterium]